MDIIRETLIIDLNIILLFKNLFSFQTGIHHKKHS